jgi:hypothetical protein
MYWFCIEDGENCMKCAIVVILCSPPVATAVRSYNYYVVPSVVIVRGYSLSYH